MNKKILALVVIIVMISISFVYISYHNENSNININPFSSTSPLSTIPIAITYTSSTVITYQQEIVIAGGYSSLINKNFSNVAFTFSNGTSIYSWFEGYNGSYIVWLKLYAFETQTINMNIYSSSTFLFSKTGYEGESPNLSSIYGEYDNGKKVFNFYTDFSGTTLNTTLWNTNSNLGYVDNGFYPILQTSGTTEPYTTLYHTENNYTDFGLASFNNGSTNENRQINRNSGNSALILIGYNTSIRLSVDGTSTANFSVNNIVSPNVYSLLITSASTNVYHNYNNIGSETGTPTDYYLGTEFITNEASNIGIRILWEDLRTDVAETPVYLGSKLPSYYSSSYGISNVAIHNMTLTLKNINLDYVNYTYPTATTRNFGNYTTVIISRHNQWNTPVLFYVSTNNSLMMYFIDNSTYVILHKWYTSPIDQTLTNSMQTISFYQNESNGNIMYIYSSYSYSSTVASPYIQLYDVLNGTYKFYNETAISSYFTEDVIINNNATLLAYNGGKIYLYDFFTNTLLLSFSVAQNNAFDLVKQNVLSTNYVSSSLTYYDFLIYHPNTNVFSYYNFTSSFGVSGGTSDPNNAPAFVKYYSNGTVMLFQVMVVSATNYIALYSEIDFYPNNTAKIIYQSVIATGVVNGFDSNSDGVLSYISNSLLLPAQLNNEIVSSTYSNYSFPFMNLSSGFMQYNSTVQKYVNNVYTNSHTYTYQYNLLNDAGYNGYISGAAINSSSLDIYWIGSFNLVSYKLEIKEIGLPVGYNWNYTFNGIKYSLTNSTYNYTLPSSSYSFSVATINGYFATYKSPIILNSNYTEYVNFTKVNMTFTLSIKESGLVSGFSWQYSFNNILYTLTNNSYNYYVPNGTYEFKVFSISGYNVNYISPITINGKNYIEYVNFTKLIYYKVDFKIFGLPANTSWAVIINNTEYISNSSSIVIELLSGIYNPVIVIPNGYSLNDVGTLVVNGNTSYYIQISQSPFNFITQNMAYLVVFIFIMMIFLIAIALRRRSEE